MNLFNAMKGWTLKALTKNLDKSIGAKTYVKSALNDIGNEVGKRGKLSAFNTMKRMTNAELAKQWRGDVRTAGRSTQAIAKEYLKKEKGEYADIPAAYTAAAEKRSAAESAAKDVGGIISTAIQSTMYSPEQKTFFVQFVNGEKTYAYPNASSNLMKGWINAGSKGKYFNRNIKRLSSKGYRGDMDAAAASGDTVFMYQ